MAATDCLRRLKNRDRTQSTTPRDHNRDRDAIPMTEKTASKVLDVVYVVLGVSPFLFLLIRWLCTGWDRKNDHVYEALRSPSVRDARNAFDRRVALAIREAKQGSRLCKGCGFSNALRSMACVLCGAELPVTKRRLFGLSARKRSGEGDGAPVVVTSRQWRVRRRKEWTRQVDLKGRIVWVLDTQFQSPGQDKFPAYVLKTEREPAPEEPTSEEPMLPDDSVVANPPTIIIGKPQEAAQDQINSNERDPATAHGDVVIDVNNNEEAAEPEAPPKPTIEDTTELLCSELNAYDIRVVQTSESNSARVAFGSSDDSPQAVQSLTDTVRNAQLDFPLKLAQFITSMASIFNETNRSTVTNERIISRFELNRESLLAESIAAIATLTPQEARSAIRVDFVDEQGIDAGGVYREWFLLLNEEIIKPEAGIFILVDEHEQTFYLNPHSRESLGKNHLAYFFAAGRLFGRALLDGNVTGFHLATPLLKIILGLPVAFSDLEYIDPDTFKNLKWLLDNDGADMLGLDFTVVEKMPTGIVNVVELVPSGGEMDVTDENKRQFVDLKLRYLFFDSVRDQLFAFLRGLYEVVPAELLMLFDTAELDYILSGSDEIDVDDWEANTIATKNINLHPAYFNFWKLVRELSAEQQRQLLQYSTGSTRVPPGGFSALTSHDGRLSLFTLQGVSADATWGCIHAHACFNRLDVPLFRDIQPLREAIQAAVTSESVGFTTV